MRDQTSGGTDLQIGAPNPDLALLALRYAAGELDPAGAEQFEARLGADQTARDALAEAVRLSAAASGAPAPTPDPLIRAAVSERLHPTWLTRLFPRRPYRGHPLAWAGVGGVLAAVVVGVVNTFSLAESEVAIVPSVRSLPPRPTEEASAIMAIDGDAVSVSVERLSPKRLDLIANSKLNPMGLQEHSPVATHTPTVVPVDPSPAVTDVAPKPMPTDPRAETKAEPAEATEPMATPIETKKG